jgi:hypothetical protein
MIPQFAEFPRIVRLRRECIITEKIDGTNASIWIADDGQPIVSTEAYGERRVPFLCGSRTRWIFPESDNHGFARWAYDNFSSVLKLGPGLHYGEWWGGSIQKRYGIPGKSFSLFNVSRWTPEAITEIGNPQIKAVPELYRGPFTTQAVDECLERLAKFGSLAVPGCMRAEGVVVYHVAANFGFKVTLGGDGHKGEAK